MFEAPKSSEGEKFTPSQQHIIDRLEVYTGETPVRGELSIGELKNLSFLQTIASIDIPHELACYEGINGLAKINTGFTEEKTNLYGETMHFDTIGDEVVHHRFERGRFNIHTHLSSTEARDLLPSQGDIHVYSKRSAYNATHNVIMNGYGFLLAGFNPFAREFDEVMRKTYSEEKDNLVQYLLQEGGWLHSSSMAFLYRKLMEGTLRLMDVSWEEKMDHLFWAAQRTGIVSSIKSWQEATPDDLTLAFDTRAAETYWNDITETAIQKVEDGMLTPQTFIEEKKQIEEEFWQRLKKSHK